MNRLLLLIFLAPFAASADTLAVVGGTVHTAGPAGTIENATIVIDDGRIVSVRAGGAAPAGAEVIDAGGKIVTPGLFTPAGRIGLVEVSGSAGPVDSVQRGDQFTAAFDPADAFNPRSTLVAINRIEGVTRAAILPNASRPADDGSRSAVISGLASVVNLGGGDDSIDRRGVAVVVNLGETGAALMADSRSLAILTLRKALDEAAGYDGDWESDEFTTSRADLDVLTQVVGGEIPLLVHVDRASDIRSLLSIADNYESMRLILSGAVEAWMLADDLAAAGVPVILSPEANLPSNFDRLNARKDSATVLAEAGVTLAFADSSATTHNARNITQSAGNAVAEGMSQDAALAAITIGPARIFGVDDRLGSIETGKAADLVIWPGDPFELTNYPDAVVIGGKQVPMQSRQTLLRDRYLDVESTTPPAWRK